MSPVSSPVCTHDLGVGTTVCLRCRQEERQAVRSRQQRFVALVCMAAMGLAGVYVVGASIVNASRAAWRQHQASKAALMVASTDVKPQGQPRLVSPPARAAALIQAPAPASAPAPAAAPVERAIPPLALAIAEGRTDLPDSLFVGGLFVERAGDSVIVNFDVVMTRTRRRDKFEGIVRETLPVAYGARTDSLLSAIPQGRLLPEGDLITELPTRGIQLSIGDGWMIDIRPETRPGRDGPLVYRYRAKVVRG